MTLEQVIPALSGGRAGEMFALADDIFNLTGPATELQASLLDDWSGHVIADIKSVDPRWYEETLVRLRQLQVVLSG